MEQRAGVAEASNQTPRTESKKAWPDTRESKQRIGRAVVSYMRPSRLAEEQLAQPAIGLPAGRTEEKAARSFSLLVLPHVGWLPRCGNRKLNRTMEPEVSAGHLLLS
ncbi:hypothetical protein TESG_07147 [Trichophyton tonsurans CBS 112818]|uniref:Uncharacterized protein n=1 Tax=Trichophyton tonsurans (strain CBS 112818) TaxID=647933 RepID=F2S8B1_TRIT1|nr:hypothetical protein TESG_07147 [Trichophyton tonsurans CBS 112818]